MKRQWQFLFPLYLFNFSEDVKSTPRYSLRVANNRLTPSLSGFVLVNENRPLGSVKIETQI